MGFFKKIFSMGDDTRFETLSMQEAQNIIQAYGKLMQTHAPTPSCVADETELPFKKDKIKQAIIIGLRATNEHHMKEMLKAGYLMLADWQCGVGKSHQGLTLSNIDIKDDPMKSAQHILVAGAEHEKWQHTIQADEAKLKQELIDLGLW